MRSERVEFKSAQGQLWSGRLELPSERPRGYAVLAHCFAGGEDGPTVSRVARGLAAGGLAVLGLDLDGRREGDGTDSGTGPAGGVDDVVAAAEHLAAHHRAPTVLVGHGAGGAAVLAAAGKLREVRAVVTIGAAAERDHLPPPGTALLVLHSPVDEVVGIENARDLFDGAGHPKSFVALDGADHRLSDEDDARFAASVAAAWVSRYLDASAPPAPEGPLAGEVTVVENDRRPYGQRVLAGRHELAVDEPRPVGQDSGPSPYDLLLAALGSCTSMTVRMYADRKKWPLDAVSVTLQHSRIHADDCSNCETEHGKLDRVERVVRLEGELDDEQRTKLLAIADRCPVHRTLHSEVVVDTSLAEGD